MDTMADSESLPTKAIRLAQNVATGRHMLSRLIPPVLLALDAALCLIIIKKVPCRSIHLYECCTVARIC